jgi:Ca-activated chloride channel family protein
MTERTHNRTLAPLLVAAVLAALGTATAQSGQQADEPRFRSSVDLINVTATVTDGDGRFVSGLQQSDFAIYDDGVRQDINYFSAERVPVSLGILLDASGSMTKEKMSAARSAIDRFIYELLGQEDELFFAEFANVPSMTQGWTTDRAAISRAVRDVNPIGGTAIYDAVATAIPKAETGRHRKKAVLVISDGNDTTSEISVDVLRRQIRESEVLVYALGIDGTPRPAAQRRPPRPPGRIPPFPIPGRPGRPRFPQIFGGGGGQWQRVAGERVNADALREITDDTGGRTEIVRGADGLDSATARIADELSRQYTLAYTSSRERDGRWHDIKVEVKNRRLTVRARRGYMAS